MDPILFDKVGKSRNRRLSQGITNIPGLLAYYPLNESSGNAINRAPSSLGSYNGTLAGDITQGVAGQLGNSYLFGATNSTITTGLDITNASFSIFFIFKSDYPSSADNVRGILNKRENDNEWRITTNNSRVLNFTGWSDSVTTTKSTNTAALTIGQWYGVLITYDGTTSSIYLNGGTPATGSSGDPIQDTAAVVIMGRESNDSDRYFSGNLQHVAIYSSVLTQANGLALSKLAGLA